LAIFAFVFDGCCRRRLERRERAGLQLRALIAGRGGSRCGRNGSEHRERCGTDHLLLPLLRLLLLVLLMAVNRGGRLRRTEFARGRSAAAAAAAASATRAVVQRPADAVPERSAGRRLLPETGKLCAVPVEQRGRIEVQVEAL